MTRPCTVAVITIACLVNAGCASTKAVETASAKPTRHVQRSAADDARNSWCAHRYDEFLAGERPGQATTIEQKQADDRVCAAIRSKRQS